MAGGDVFAVTFHCMVEGDRHCQQHYMTDREEEGAGGKNISPLDIYFVLYLCKITSSHLNTNNDFVC